MASNKVADVDMDRSGEVVDNVETVLGVSVLETPLFEPNDPFQALVQPPPEKIKRSATVLRELNKEMIERGKVYKRKHNDMKIILQRVISGFVHLGKEIKAYNDLAGDLGTVVMPPPEEESLEKDATESWEIYQRRMHNRMIRSVELNIPKIDNLAEWGVELLKHSNLKLEDVNTHKF